jgi:hypothetical protein
MCTELVWLDKGNMLTHGAAKDVADKYDSYMSNDDVVSMRQSDNFKREGTGEARITAVRILDGDGDEKWEFQTHDSLIIEMDYIAHEEIKTPEFRVAIHREDGLHINDPNTHAAGMDIEKINGKGTVRYTISDLPLMPANYLITTAIHNAGYPRTYDYHEKAYSFRVIAGGTARQWGAIEIAAVWELQPEV